MSATWEDHAVRVSDVLTDARFPRWGPTVARIGIGSTTSVPLSKVRQGKVATALSVFAPAPGAFDDDQVAARLRSYAVQAVTALRVAGQLAGLRSAMDSRHRIGLAQGILMARHAWTTDEAFDLLTAAARSNNARFTDVVDAVVEQGELPTEYRPRRAATSERTRPRSSAPRRSAAAGDPWTT
ncbi:hypothetical protein GCM10028777_10240 [Angustibacter speluncae]